MRALPRAEPPGCAREWPELQERHTQGEPEIDGLLQGVSALGEMRQGLQRLLEARYGLLVGGTPTSPGSSLTGVNEGLVPHLSPKCMLCKPVDLGG